MAEPRFAIMLTASQLRAVRAMAEGSLLFTDADRTALDFLVAAAETPEPHTWAAPVGAVTEREGAR